MYYNTTIYILQSTVVFEYLISSVADVGDYELREYYLQFGVHNCEILLSKKIT